MALNLEIRARPVRGNRLIDDYVRGESALAPFFPGSPFDPDAYRRKAAEVRDRFEPESLAAMASAVRPLSEEARRRLDSAAAGDGFVVTTGQQPGLFGGPLYTVHKALTAIALARRLEEVLRVPVLPLFWVASDDHDWAEANHVAVLDPSNRLHRLTLTGHPETPRSMGRLELGDRAETALTKLSEVLPPSDFTESIMERLRAHWGQGSGHTVAAAFAATMASLLEGLPIGLVDAQDPTVRELGRPVIRRELDRSAEHERALAGQTARLEAAGYEAQVPILESASNVFLEDERNGRQRLLREDGGWVLRASKERLSSAELEGLLEADPGRFSANVVLGR